MVCWLWKVRPFKVYQIMVITNWFTSFIVRHCSLVWRLLQNRLKCHSHSFYPRILMKFVIFLDIIINLIVGDSNDRFILNNFWLLFFRCFVSLGGNLGQDLLWLTIISNRWWIQLRWNYGKFRQPLGKTTVSTTEWFQNFVNMINNDDNLRSHWNFRLMF